MKKNTQKRIKKKKKNQKHKKPNTDAHWKRSVNDTISNVPSLWTNGEMLYACCTVHDVIHLKPTKKTRHKSKMHFKCKSASASASAKYKCERNAETEEKNYNNKINDRIRLFSYVFSFWKRPERNELNEKEMKRERKKKKEAKLSLKKRVCNYDHHMWALKLFTVHCLTVRYWLYAYALIYLVHIHIVLIAVVQGILSVSFFSIPCFVFAALSHLVLSVLWSSQVRFHLAFNFFFFQLKTIIIRNAYEYNNMYNNCRREKAHEYQFVWNYLDGLVRENNKPKKEEIESECVTNARYAMRTAHAHKLR